MNPLDKVVSTKPTVDPLRKRLAELVNVIAWTVALCVGPVVIFVWRALL